jgi:hypothetical protein
MENITWHLKQSHLLRFLRFYFLVVQALADLKQKHLLLMLLLQQLLLLMLLLQQLLLLMLLLQQLQQLLLLMLPLQQLLLLMLLLQQLLLLMLPLQPRLLTLLLRSNLFRFKLKPGYSNCLVFLFTTVIYLLSDTLFPHQYEYFLSQVKDINLLILFKRSGVETISSTWHTPFGKGLLISISINLLFLFNEKETP